MTEPKKRALHGAALAHAAHAQDVRERILEIMRRQPASSHDLNKAGLGARSVCVAHLAVLRGLGFISVVTRLPNTSGPRIPYYRASGYEQSDDIEFCLVHHTEVCGLPAPKFGKVSEEELESRFEQQLRDAARAKSQKIKPFRCALTTALYGPYAKGKS